MSQNYPPHTFVHESHTDGTIDNCYLCGSQCPHCVELSNKLNALKRQPLTAGDTLLSHKEFVDIVNLARHVVAVSRGDQKHIVTVRDVTFASFILELVDEGR